jgi:hypothetical protein
MFAQQSRWKIAKFWESVLKCKSWRGTMASTYSGTEVPGSIPAGVHFFGKRRLFLC